MTTTTTAVDLATLLQNPYAREAATCAGYMPGAVLDGDDIDDLISNMAALGYYVHANDARTNGALGWNLRCNRCGSYGATWTKTDERPGWGALALCPPHKQELADEHQRHAAALRRLRLVNFEQPPPQPSERRHRGYDDY